MNIYIYYSNEEFELLKNEAEKYGFESVSAYAKYLTLLPTRQKDEYDIVELINEQQEALLNIKEGETFIVSALTPEAWPHLSKGAKSTLSAQLKKIIESNPDKYEIAEKNRRVATIYRKKVVDNDCEFEIVDNEGCPCSINEIESNYVDIDDVFDMMFCNYTEEEIEEELMCVD